MLAEKHPHACEGCLEKIWCILRADKMGDRPCYDVMISVCMLQPCQVLVLLLQHIIKLVRPLTRILSIWSDLANLKTAGIHLGSDYYDTHCSCETGPI